MLHAALSFCIWNDPDTVAKLQEQAIKLLVRDLQGKAPKDDSPVTLTQMGEAHEKRYYVEARRIRLPAAR